MITIHVDSRFINAGIYIIMDVAVFAILHCGLTSAQTWHIKRRLLQGRKVSVQELSPLTLPGGIVSDGTSLSFVFVAANVLLMAVLFSLTLGVNGRSDNAYRPIEREYISGLAPSDVPLVAEERIYPQILASCSVFQGYMLIYFAVAFNIEQNRMALTNQSEERPVGVNVGLAVNSTSVLCQDYKSAKPLLRVLKCGTDLNACCNLFITEPQDLILERGGGGEQNWLRNGNVSWFGTTALFRNNVYSVSSQVSSLRYNRLICLSTQSESSPNGEVGMNCMLGVWSENKKAFTFRLGNINLRNRTVSFMLNTTLHRKVKFNPYSVEIEIEWDAYKEEVLSNGLHSIGGNMVPARLFLDTFVSRSSQPISAAGTVVYQKYEVLVTDISMTCLVGYGILTALGVAVGCGTLWMKCRKSDTDAIPEVNTYQGLLRTLSKFSENQTDPRDIPRLAFRFADGMDNQSSAEAKSSSLIVIGQQEASSSSNIWRGLQLAWTTNDRKRKDQHKQPRGRSRDLELSSESDSYTYTQ